MDGAKVNTVDEDGFTPLLIAARWGKLEMVKFLVEDCGSCLTATTNHGDTAFVLAERF